jgi:pyruvate/2-oxoglutarate dehydrogenase complex dihydrolipoamide acyltransferase (E2) component
MPEIRIDGALWASSMMPEGVVERWFVADGAVVATGDRIAQVRIEDARHEIVAPAQGRLSIVATTNAVIEPGSLLARLIVNDTPSRV